MYTMLKHVITITWKITDITTHGELFAARRMDSTGFQVRMVRPSVVQARRTRFRRRFACVPLGCLRALVSAGAERVTQCPREDVARIPRANIALLGVPSRSRNRCAACNPTSIAAVGRAKLRRFRAATRAVCARRSGIMRPRALDRARSCMWALLLGVAHAALLSVSPAQAPILSVMSSDGRHVAELTPRTASELAPDGSRTCDLTVYDVAASGARSARWRTACEHREGNAGQFLSTDGGAFVEVDDRFATDRPLVRVIREGSASTLDARSLRLPEPGAGDATWIALTPRACRLRDAGAQHRIDLLGRDGVLRSIDLVVGSVEVTAALEWARGAGAAAKIEPSARRDAAPELAIPYVDSATVLGPYALAGDAVPLEVVGGFPTPGFELVGFDIAVDAADPTRLTITPLAKAPSGIVAQVLSPLHATAKISALRIGRYSIDVRGREPTTTQALTDVEVLPRSVLVQWGSRDSGEWRTIALLSDGRVVLASDARSMPSVALAPVDVWGAIETKVRALPPEGASWDARSNAALVWPSGGELVVARRYAPNLERSVREIVDLLEAFAKPGPTRYAIDSSASRIEVRTSSAGLLSVFGHDHTIATRAVSGFVDLAERDFEHATVEVSIRADSLAVVDEGSRKDRPEIEAEMREHVLDVAHHPAIVFRSTRVSAKPLGPLTSDVSLAGKLELCGVKREIAVNLRVGLDGAELQARGAFDLRQSDFGIQPTSAAAGTVKVDDKVRIEFDIRARASR
jgi:polyisoprenoid-binding protein YceI